MESAVKPKVMRPKSCGALAAIDAEHGQNGCKRLPRHKGEHRATLHVQHVKVALKGRKVRKSASVQRREFAAKLAARVESGKLTAAEALSRMSAYVGRASGSRRSTGAAEPVVTREMFGRETAARERAAENGGDVGPMRPARRSRAYVSGVPAMRRPAIA